MTDAPDRTESLFAAAVALADADERAAYLDQACGGDATLRGHVEALLRAHARAGHLLDRPVPGGPEQTRAYVPPEQPGAVIAGRYKLLEAIGEGGMGSVWVAEQTQPVRRKVALKLIKAGMDSKAVLARFEAERQALAVMDHPNIAKVLDGGVTDTGRPFFVMEYVKGVPITEYCEATRLSVPQRLQLFVQVCSAVQHAHQKGIIHRDLKPSNILVAPYDDRPVPKVIDFGLAKALHQPLTERTLHTAHEAVLGTPLYMSPEQAQLNNLDVDTRSDIYSLGVLLYELLTGTTPLEKKRFADAAWEEIRRLIREEEPPRPSTRLSSTDTLPSLAAGRQTEPARLTKLVRGELDWIVMKALEKDRNRRYETANGFARDVERYLAGEPVLAAPPGTRYRLGKFARKHRAALTTAALVALLLALGTAISTWQAVRARWAETAARAAAEAEADQRAEAEQQRDRAVQAEGLAQQRLQQATAEKERADRERAVAVAVAVFLQDDLLSEAAPERNARNKKVTVEEVLARAASRIAGKFERQPELEAAIRLTVGRTYRALGDYPAAQPHLERARELYSHALGEEDLFTLLAMTDLGLLYQQQGQNAKAESLLVKVLEVSRRVLGDEHPDTLTSVHNLGALYRAWGQYARAEPLLVQALEASRRVRGEEHPATLLPMRNLAMVYEAQGQYAKAEPLLVRALEVGRRAEGEAHPHTLAALGDLGALYRAWGQYARAEPLLVQALEAKRRVLGEEHPYTLMAMHSLGLLYAEQDQYGKAEPLLVQALEISRRVQGEEHPETLAAMNNLALLYRAQGQYAKAEPLLRAAVAGARRKFGLAHPHTQSFIGNWADCCGRLWQPAGPEPLCRELADCLKRQSGADSPQYAGALAFLGHNLLHQKKWADAESVLRECLAIRDKKEPKAWTTFNTRSMLGGSLLGQAKYAEAEPLLLVGYEGMKQREEKISHWSRCRLAEAAERLARLYEATGKKAEAAKWWNELGALRAANKPEAERK
jgi:serine/threonine protein kinase